MEKSVYIVRILGFRRETKFFNIFLLGIAGESLPCAGHGLIGESC